MREGERAGNLEKGNPNNKFYRQNENKCAERQKKHDENRVEIGDNDIQIMYTNIRAMTREKVPMIKSYVKENSVIIITETWGHEVELAEMEVRQCRRREERGGGVLIGIPREWRITEEGNITGEEGDDYYVKVTGDRDKAMWIVSIYVQPGNVRVMNRKYRQLGRCIERIFRQEKQPRIIIAGDFNCDVEAEEKKIDGGRAQALSWIREYDMMIQNFGEYTFKRGEYRSKIDFVITSRNVEIEDKKTAFTAVSDHAILTARSTMAIGGGRIRHVIPNRGLGERLFRKAIEGNKEPERLLEEFAWKVKRAQHRRAKTIGPRDEGDWRAEVQEIFKEGRHMEDIRGDLSRRWKGAWKEFEQTRFSEEQKKAFQSLKRMTKYHQIERAGGGIANMYRDENGNIIREGREVSKGMIGYLEQLHTAPEQQRIEANGNWKGLPKLTVDDTIKLMEQMPRNKAIGFDLWTDAVFVVKRGREGKVDKETMKRAEALRDSWNTSWINHENTKMITQARMIPLNKKFPNIPRVDDKTNCGHITNDKVFRAAL